MAFDSVSLHHQAQRQLATYWRVRITQVLDHLENEVRRMVRLEDTLERFAVQFVSRLSVQRQQWLAMRPEQQATTPLPTAPFQWVEQGIASTRTLELKQRYRQLARELHPDFAGTDNEQPRMSAVSEAYARADLAALIRFEAQSLAPTMAQVEAMEAYVRQVEQASQTYRQAYTQLLNTPLYSLYARAASAQEDGWDYAAALARKFQRALEAAA
jgi:hypothetical protein